MNRQVVDLGFTVRQFPQFKFSMRDFVGRLKLQKAVYLLQAFGVNLGYGFSWYLRGPYCSILATNAFAVQEFYDKIPEESVRFENGDAQKRFERFLKFIDGKDADSLEIAASLHYLKTTSSMDDDNVIRKVEQKQPHFKMERVKAIFEELGRYEVI